MLSRDEVAQRMKGPLAICDTTLKDGEMVAGMVFSNIEKYRVAKQLDEVGVPMIELGSPSIGVDDEKAVRHIAKMGLDACISVFCGMDPGDVAKCIDCGADAVSIAVPASDEFIAMYGLDRQAVTKLVFEAVTAANGAYVTIVALDASRADIGFLVTLGQLSRDIGASCFRYCDTVGVEDPMKAQDRINLLRQIVKIDFQYQASNDFGLATANSIAAIRAGAISVVASCLGIGERAGNAALEQVAMAAESVLGIKTGIKASGFRALADTVSGIIGGGIPRFAPIVGPGIYAFENGVIEGDSFKSSRIGIPFKPEDVGYGETLVIGKHTFPDVINSLFEGTSKTLSEEDVKQLHSIVVRAVNQLHRPVTKDEVFMFYNDMIRGIDIFDE